jgi:hypothetical protein
MQVKSALVAIGIAAVSSLVWQTAAEAGRCRGALRGWCGPQPVRHYVYYPNQYNVYYMATFAPNPYPQVYVPRGYWPRYRRPYARYGRPYWAPRRWMNCCNPVAYYPVPAPQPVPVEGGYLK